MIYEEVIYSLLFSPEHLSKRHIEIPRSPGWNPICSKRGSVASWKTKQAALCFKGMKSISLLMLEKQLQPQVLCLPWERAKNHLYKEGFDRYWFSSWPCRRRWSGFLNLTHLKVNNVGPFKLLGATFPLIRLHVFLATHNSKSHLAAGALEPAEQSCLAGLWKTLLRCPLNGKIWTFQPCMMMLGAARSDKSLLFQVFGNCSANVRTVQLAAMFSSSFNALS